MIVTQKVIVSGTISVDNPPSGGMFMRLNFATTTRLRLPAV
jgi:hypothetical protein